VARVRRILGGAKVGHAGTLDPDATGVLVLCVGKATKLSAFLMEGEKVYVGRGRLGVTTDTQDASGQVIRERPVTVTPDDVRRAAERFVGRIEQIPPMFSAVKVDGRKLYRLARQGLEVERAARPVTVFEFEIGAVELPEFDFSLRCSKGTYVRTLVHDLGAALDCGAHLVRLQRAAQASFRCEDALSMASLEGPDAAEVVRRACLTPEASLEFLPARATSADAATLRVGALLPREASGGPDGLVRLVDSGKRLVAIARVGEEGVRLLHVFPPKGAFGRGRREP
jgi:tRNA pseudouridine55 synthase